MKKLLHLLEAGLVYFLISGFRLLPADLASFLGGWMARAIGPLLSVQRVAFKNLERALPQLSLKERQKIVRDMWDNLGRTVVELTHLPGKKFYGRMRFHGLEYLPKPGEAVLFFSGHIGNWELLSSIAYDHGAPLTLIYRHANNPYVDKWLAEFRASHATNMFPKGLRGAVKMARSIKNGESLAMLVDQKMNDGIAVPFFGRDAMTAPALAMLALRYDMKIIPARVIRKKGVDFDAYLYPPLAYEKTGDEARDILNIMTRVNATLEGWIREAPGQWFWVHNRWPKGT